VLVLNQILALSSLNILLVQLKMWNELSFISSCGVLVHGLVNNLTGTTCIEISVLCVEENAMLFYASSS